MPPAMKWLRQHWKAVVIGAALFLVGVGIGAAGSSGDDAQPAAQEVSTVTVSGEGETVTEQSEAEILTVTETARAEPEPKVAATTKHVYKGNGSKTVTIRTSGGTVRWTNDGDLFQLWTDDLSIFVNSQAHSGATVVPSGRHKLTVNAIGNWTIRVPS